MSKPNAVTLFQFNSHDVRVFTDDSSEPLWMAKDVCDVLGYANAARTVNDHCRKAGIRKRYIRSGGQKREVTCIDEGNLYRLIIKSTKPESESFESWVCDEVLPTIRKTGSFTQPSNEKRINVKHTHLRSTTAPGELDIRYNLDLTKLITKPSQQTLAIIERLTGIKLSDIEVAETSSLEMLIFGFIDEECEYGEGFRIPAEDLYFAFSRWHSLNGHGAPPSIKRFSSIVGEQFQKIKSSKVYYLGLRIPEEAKI